MKDYKAYIFDFDLTLADSSKGILECFRHTLKYFGYEVPDDRAIYNTIGLTLQDAFDILTDTPMNPKRDEMRKVYVEKANDVMSAHTYFYEDTLPILEKLRANNIKTAIVSTKMRYRIVESFEVQLGIHPYDVIVGLEDVTAPKPDPQGIIKAMELLGVDKDEVLYVGDSYIDAETAVNAGVDFAAVTTGPTDKETFMRYPNIAIGSSLSEALPNIMNSV
ncbi:HAD family hydrolase [Ruminococcus albus]|uniref:Phosphoglycolate phosphatase n=1 Tax=Ruminococcus albus TaxID=1264 RepID=A0A1H7F1A9_RUMAL|nr:HAD family hydrolase [Ruminococcus albus]SEK19936.1 phosphoglycolate phosphatase [Ruminococcus albus]